MGKAFFYSLISFAVNIVLSLVVLNLLAQGLQLDIYQQMIVGALFFICLLVLQHNYGLSKLAKLSDDISTERATYRGLLEDAVHVSRMRDALEDLSPMLHKIAEGMELLSSRYGAEDLFVQWYQCKLSSVSNHLQHTLEAEAFDFNESMLRERPRILDMLLPHGPVLLWAVSPLKAIPGLADPDGSAYLRQVDERFLAGQFSEIRRIFIYDTKDELESLDANILFRLHELSGYEYRIIAREDVDAIYKVFADKTLARDFGIWGHVFVWETPDQNIITRVGEICRRPTRIERYKQLYSELWGAGKSYKVENQKAIEVCKKYRIDRFRELLAYCH